MKNQKLKWFKLPFAGKFLLYVILFLSTFFAGCEKQYDNIIDYANPHYQVTLVSPSDSVKYKAADSLVALRISFSPDEIENIYSVYCDVYTSDNSKLTSSPLNLFDNGNAENADPTKNDGTFSNKIPLSKYYPNGVYTINYFISDKSNLTKRVAQGTFIFNNGQPNFTPVISNDIVNPDTALVTTPTLILTTIKAEDKNGSRDIGKVYFIVYRPDGTTSNSQNLMFDDGDRTVNGDQVAGDGIYSLLIQISPQNAKGTYNLVFQAQDRSNELSNIINHNLLIQ